MTAAPGMLALQRAMVWLVGASGAIVFIEPSPYEIATLLATLVFFATGLRLRLVFMPLLLLLFLLNVGYTIGAVPVLDRAKASPTGSRPPGTWRSRSIFFAMVVSEDTEARLDMLRRGLIVGAMIAAICGGRRLFQPGARRP